MKKQLLRLLTLGVMLIACKKEEEIVKSKEQRDSELAEKYFGRPIEGNYKGRVRYRTSGYNIPTIDVDTAIVITKVNYSYFINGTSVGLILPDQNKVVLSGNGYNFQGSSGRFEVYDFPDIIRNGVSYYTISGKFTRLTN